MKRALAALVSLVVVGACERSAPKSNAPPASRTAEPAAAPAATENERVAVEIRAQMAAFLTYGEKVFAIMREHGKDCDVAAKHLGERVAEFQELGPRMMKAKEQLASLPQAEQDRIKADSETMMQDFQKRFADADALDARAKECEKTSAAFAEVAPKVMFTKKK